ncbi:MAG TPA: lysophospholipid acyltransferase family protein [Longimicrobiaceae bacterium]
MGSVFSPAAVAAFELLFRPWMRRRVHAVRVAGLPTRIPPAQPLLLAANHATWWDGFVLREVQRMLRPGAPLYTVMSAAELDRFPFFRRLGVVGIDAGSPASVARAVRFLEARIRDRPDSVVAYFPQGRIWPTHRRPLDFRRGVEIFARRLGAVVLPVGLHAEPLNTVSPTFFVSVGEPLDGAPEAAELERHVEAQLDAIHRFLAEHGEDAPRLWPGPFEPLEATRDPVRGAR